MNPDQTSITPEERFAALVEELAGNPGVATPVASPSDAPHSESGFGSSALKVHRRIFAMLVRGKLVVKLPKARVDALIASGDGERYDPRGDGRLMKEWVAIGFSLAEQWLPLAREAMAYVASAR